MINDTKLYTASDLAKLADVSPSYVARLCRDGKLPAMKVGPAWIIQANDAEAWLAKRSEHQTTD